MFGLRLVGVFCSVWAILKSVSSSISTVNMKNRLHLSISKSMSLMLQEHNLDIRHIKGRDNIIPDTLSRA